MYHRVDETFTLPVDGSTKESGELIWRAQNKPNKTFPVTKNNNKRIPGSVASGRTLRRTTEANRKANRGKAIAECKRYFGYRYSKGETKSCDEYPFASTAEGAKTGSDGQSPNRHYAVEAMNDRHNSNAGSKLSEFYRDQRMLRTQDVFYVKLVNPDGTPYKGPSEPSGAAAQVNYRQCSGDLPQIKEVQRKAAPEQKFLNYAQSTASGWTGGDSTYSVDLPDGRRLFLFSDTFLGPENADGSRPENAKIINSSFVAQSGGSLSTIKRGSSSNPMAIMPPTIKGERWYWLGDGMIATIDGRKYLQVVFQEYRHTHDGTELPLEFVRNVVATFELSNLKRPIWIDPLPSEIGVAWGSALLPKGRSGDNYTYIYGVSNEKRNKKMHIARVYGKDLSDVKNWQFIKKSETVPDKWMKNEKDGTKYLPGVMNEYSVTPWRDQFVVISQDSTEAFSSKIRLWSGCDPYSFGFWVDNDEVYRMPEVGLWGSYGDPQVVAYNAHAHPTLQSGDRWTLSYNVNTFDFSDHFLDTSIYKPRFVSFRLVPWSGGTRSSKNFVPVE
ncbi:NucA/NucB deoxyribonuclease domain-containing protein [Streptomyces synnematoformans]|uniref:Deoxyribonuclease NucA/NucB domain-containing protein n=1 Tax=Streptomyces synnematoformans TaxID=415721 RepID=A0ABP5JRS2_9ACTN